MDSHEFLTSDSDIGGHIFTEKSRKIIEIAKLQQKSQRNKTKLFLLEGANSVEFAIEAGVINEILLNPNMQQHYAKIISRAIELQISIAFINETASHKLAQTKTTPGIFAVARKIPAPNLDLASSNLLLVLDNIQDPGNLGTMIRLADAFAASAVVITGQTVDIWNAKVIRASAGSIFNLPIIYRAELSTLIQELKANKIKVLATSGYASQSLPEIHEELKLRIAWILGNEAHGLDKEIIDLADQAVSIPMLGKAESLNVTTAAAICLYTSAQAQLQS